MASSIKTIKTITRFEEVVKLFGGPKKLCTALGFGKTQSGQSIHIWRKEKKFPTKHYFSLQYMLLEKGCVAAPTLFSFEESIVPVEFIRWWIANIDGFIFQTWRSPKRRKALLRVHKGFRGLRSGADDFGRAA